MALRVGINASFLRKRATGIGQVTEHFLKELSRTMDTLEQSTLKKKDIEFFVYLEEPLPADIVLSKKFTARAFLPLLWKRDDLIRKTLWEQGSLPRQAHKDKCDVLLSLYQSATMASNRMDHIMLVHDIIPKIFPEYLSNTRKRKYQALIEKAIGEADKVVTVSKYTKDDLVRYLGLDPNAIVVNSIDVDPIFKQTVSKKQSRETLNRYRLQAGYIYLGGGLEKRKNAEGLLRAYRLLVDQNKKKKFIEVIPKLVISGKLMPELAPLITDVTRLVKELGLSNRVKILGFVSQEDLPALYANASMFVFPSLYEGFGMPVLEAMSQGVPVITSRSTSLPEVGKKSVLYCNPEDVADMTRAMKKLLLNVSLRDTLGASGKVTSLSFSWSTFVQKMLRLL